MENKSSSAPELEAEVEATPETIESLTAKLAEAKAIIQAYVDKDAKPEINSIQVYKVSNGFSLQAYDETQPAVKKVALDLEGVHNFVDEQLK